MWHSAGLEIGIIGVESRIRAADVMLVISRCDASLLLFCSQVQILPQYENKKADPLRGPALFVFL